MMGKRELWTYLTALWCWVCVVDAFVPPQGVRRMTPAIPSTWNELVVLEAKKKRRKRKQPPKPAASSAKAPVKAESVAPAKEVPVGTAKDIVEPIKEADVSEISDVAQFEFKPDGEISKGAEGEKTMKVGAGPASDTEPVDLSALKDVASFEFVPDDAITKGVQDEEIKTEESTEGAIPLPDIRQALRNKQIEEELARIEEEKEEMKVKIDRKDKKALAKLLEQQPYADADDSLFLEEEYGTVSALLGEGAKSFLGIPPGPLQVGHFIGSLVIILMAFIEYPGFPLTNLPSPLRGALQGGLGTIYAINIVLAGLSFFAAGKRGQSGVLWAAKAFSVGGLAYDQLTQLPTLEQVEKAKARKGKRALKNRRK